jgi:hypothetical protein
MIRRGIEQVNDPVRIQIQGRHLLPKPLGAVLVGPDELGLRQLTGEEEDQLTLFDLGKAPGRPPTAPGPERSRAAGGRHRRPAL